MQVLEVKKLQSYLNGLFRRGAISIRARSKKDDCAEVYINNEFIAMLYRDDDEGEISYNFQMAILEIDLPDEE